MRFRLKTNITEDDFLRSMYFGSLESTPGKKALLKNRIRILALYAILTVMVLVMKRPLPEEILLYLAFVAVYSAVHMLLYKRMAKSRLKRWLSKALKNGDAHFDPEAEYVFYEDKMVETTALTSFERKYDGVTAVNFIGDDIIEICHSAVVCILPVEQVRQQVDYDAFVQFLAEKCKYIEVYKGK